MHTSREGGERFSEISPPFRTAKTMVRVNMTVIVLPSVRARAELYRSSYVLQDATMIWIKRRC